MLAASTRGILMPAPIDDYFCTKTAYSHISRNAYAIAGDSCRLIAAIKAAHDKSSFHMATAVDAAP